MTTQTDAPADYVEAFEHTDGSVTYILHDEDMQNPRDDYDHFATLVNRSSRTNAMDLPDPDMIRAYNRWRWADVANGQISCVGLAGRCPCRNCGDNVPASVRSSGLDSEGLMRRYVSMFRPDIVYVTTYWNAGESYGWGYVERDGWEAAMGDGAPVDGDVTPAKLFDDEVREYDQWARGEVYGYVHIDAEGTETDSCWGFLGYESLRDIAAQATSDAPLVSA